MKRYATPLQFAAIAAVGLVLLAWLTVPDLQTHLQHQLQAYGMHLSALLSPGASGLILANAPFVIERKSGAAGDDLPGNVPAEVKKKVEELFTVFTQFKGENDKRINELEKRGNVPADVETKLSAMNTDMTKLSAEIQDILKKMQRPGAAAADSKGLTPEQAEYKAGLKSYLWEGKETGLRDLEAKTITRGSDPDGGFFVGTEMDAEIDRVASTDTALVRLATTRNIGKAEYKKFVKTRGMSGTWLGETDDLAEGQGPQYAEVKIEAHRIGVEPWVTNDMLEDVDYDLEGDLTDEAALGFSEAEGEAFILGDGVKRARGILGYDMVANANYKWGKVGYINTGNAGDFAAADPGNKLIDLQHALRSGYRSGASWLMADSTLAKVRQMRDGSSGYYLWQPDPLAAFGGRLLGAPVEIDDYMPAIAANSYSIAYGNLKRAYTIVRRRGIAVIRDNVTRKGTTKFHFSRRTGGGITQFEAIKFLKFA